MSGLEADTIGGFNSMIEKQKKQDGKCYVSTVLFDDRIEVVHDRVELHSVNKMTEDDYFVRGCTALIDAIGSSIRHIANIHKYARPEDVPQNTMFVITTDGMENASHQFSSDEVKRMIKKEKRLNVIDINLFKKLVRDSFKQKRKTLKNNLKSYNLEVINKVLNKNGYNLSSRAEQIPINVFVEISNELFMCKNN